MALSGILLAACGGGGGGSSPGGTVAPAAPSNLAALATSSGSIDLSWTDGSNNETGFKVERSDDDGASFVQITTVSANVARCSDTGLTPSKTYYYKVRATNKKGDSGYTGTANATTWQPPITIPNAPSALTATTISSTQIDLGWKDNSTNETGFKIERSDNGGVSFVQIATVSANAVAYSDTVLTPSTIYYYQVKATNSKGDSGYSTASDTTDPPPVTKPNAPSVLTATTISGSQIDLGWTDNSTNETSFIIERSTDGTTFTNLATVTTNITVYSDTGLLPSATYYYRVRATNSAGDSSYSNIASDTTLATIPNAPSNLTATRMSSSQIDLSWTDNSADETGFKVERSDDGGASFIQIATVSTDAVTYSDNSLIPSTTYYYKVKATNSAGDSSYSSNAQAATATTLAWPTASDGVEGDDTSAGAATVTLGSSVHRALYPDGDVDFFKVSLLAGTTYEFSANNLNANADTFMYLYDTDGVTQLDYNDDCETPWTGLGSCIQYTPPTDGYYYIQVMSWFDGNNFGPVGLASYTFNAHVFVDNDGDGVSSYYDCDDNNAAIYPYANEIPGDGISQNCSGVDAMDGVVPDTHEPDNISSDAKALSQIDVAPSEITFRHDLFAAEGRTITSGDIDWVSISVPAKSAVEVGVAYSLVAGTNGLRATFYDSDASTVLYWQDSSSVWPFYLFKNTTPDPKTFYVKFEADDHVSTGYYVPYAVSYGTDNDDDGYYTRDQDAYRDCDDTDPAVYPGSGTGCAY